MVFRPGTKLANDQRDESGRSVWYLAVYDRFSSRAQSVLKREWMAHNLYKSVSSRLAQLHSLVGVKQLIFYLYQAD